jgi:hypothetical protein
LLDVEDDVTAGDGLVSLVALVDDDAEDRAGKLAVVDFQAGEDG